MFAVETEVWPGDSQDELKNRFKLFFALLARFASLGNDRSSRLLVMSDLDDLCTAI